MGTDPDWRTGTMRSRLLSKGSGPDFGESRHCSPAGAGGYDQNDQEVESDAVGTEALLKTRINGAIQGIGNNLERMQISLAENGAQARGGHP